jgi:hypothetical protein
MKKEYLVAIKAFLLGLSQNKSLALEGLSIHRDKGKSLKNLYRLVFYSIILAEIERAAKGDNVIEYRTIASEASKEIETVNGENPYSIYMKLVEVSVHKVTTADFGDLTAYGDSSSRVELEKKILSDERDGGLITMYPIFETLRLHRELVKNKEYNFLMDCELDKILRDHTKEYI